jgi:PAS domain S-box-containing protein
LTRTGYLILDAVGKVVDANDEYVRLSGHSELREIRGRSVVEWTAERAQKKNAEAVARCAKDGFIRDFVTEYTDKSGKITPVEINAKVEGEGESLRIISLCRDISERKRIEEELAEMSDEMDRFFQMSGDMLCIASTDGFFKKLNPAWEAVLGFSVRELLSRKFVEFIHPEDVGPTFREVEKQINGGSTIHFVNRYRCKDGAYKSLEWTATPAKGGTILFASARDITERERRENEMARRAEEMEIFYKASLGREERIIELKEEVRALREELGRGGA